MLGEDCNIQVLGFKTSNDFILSIVKLLSFDIVITCIHYLFGLIFCSSQDNQTRIAQTSSRHFTANNVWMCCMTMLVTKRRHASRAVMLVSLCKLEFFLAFNTSVAIINVSGVSTAELGSSL